MRLGLWWPRWLLMDICKGDCERCRESSVFKELTPEARARLTEQFAFLSARYRRLELARARAEVRYRRRWDYPYE